MFNPRLLLLVLSGLLFSLPVFAQLSLAPEKIELQDISKSESVFVSHNGLAVLPGDITKIVAGVYKYQDDVPADDKDGTHFSNYSYMFEFLANQDGSITITPNKANLQIGIYSLYVHTIHGMVTGVIDANLKISDSIKSSPPSTSSDFTYSISLPDYLYGQLIAIDLKADMVNTYSWYIDGEIHSSGSGKTSFRARPEVGDHEISYTVHNPEGTEISAWSGTTTVSGEPAVSMSVRKGDKVPFTAPGGYARVIWALDGKVVADNHPDPSHKNTQRIAFRNKGRHILTCKLQNIENEKFRLISWDVKVK